MVNSTYNPHDSKFFLYLCDLNGNQLAVLPLHLFVLLHKQKLHSPHVPQICNWLLVEEGRALFIKPVILPIAFGLPSIYIETILV